MSVWRYLLWFVLASAATGLLIETEHLIKKNGHRIPELVFLAVRILLVPLLGIWLVYSDTVTGWRYNLAICAFYLASLGTVCGDLLCHAMAFASRIDLKKYGHVISFVHCEKNRICLNLLTAAAVFLFGTLCSQIILPKSYTFRSEKLENTRNIVFVSDLHYGSAQPEAVVRRLFERIRKEQPDLLILGGDITDEFTSKEQMETVYRIIGETGIRTVAIEGNHDRQAKSDLACGRTYTDEELENAMEQNGVRLLKEEYLQIGPDFVLLGRADRRKPEERTMTDSAGNPAPEALFVVLDHIAYPEDDLLAMGADLQLSGHSHGGQYFPLQMIYELARANPVGEYRYGNSVQYTSVGASCWRCPFRTEKFCRYERITLVPSE